MNPVMKERIQTYYKRVDKDPIRMACMFRDATRHAPSQQALSRKVGISAAAVSHYVGLLGLPDDLQEKVSKGELPFKVARAFVSPELDHERVQKLIVPFIEGELTSSHVEAYITMAKKHPRLGAPDLTRLILNGNRAYQTATPEAEEQVTPTRPPRPTSLDVREQAFEMVGTLLDWEPDGTIDSMLAKQALKKLEGVLKERVA